MLIFLRTIKILYENHNNIWKDSVCTYKILKSKEIICTINTLDVLWTSCLFAKQKILYKKKLNYEGAGCHPDVFNEMGLCVVGISKIFEFFNNNKYFYYILITIFGRKN